MVQPPIPPPPPVVLVEEVLTPIPTPPTIDELIERYADKYDLSTVKRKQFLQTLKCESNLNPNVQSGKLYQNGNPEQSYGLAQIHLPSHPEITKAEALDPDFALDFMAHQFKVGHEELWSCWRDLFE